MKKLLLMVLLMSVFTIQAQYTEIKFPEDTYILQNFDLSSISGSDTTFIFKMVKKPVQAWSIQSVWSGVTGAGILSLEVTNFDELTGWTPYAASLSTTITGSAGIDAWEDTMWAWKYFKLKITKGSLTSGLLKLKIYIN